MGHPEPFGLKYVEIGNEAHSPGTDDALDHYAERYLQFYKAIKTRYPDMNIIGDGYWNGDDWNLSHPVDIVDAHYYATPSFFYNSLNRYDKKDRSKYKYYIGEYAVTENFGKVGNLNAALAEAVFMMGLERNGDVVQMASYAPMFCNDDYWGWWPTEMMHFNSSKSFCTPSYYIQKLFPNHLGTTNVAVENTATVAVPHTVGLVTWNTAAKATNLKVTDTKTGLPLITASYMASASNWTTTGKQWTIGKDSVVQADNANSNLRAILNKKFDSNHYTIEATLTKTSGSEGFIIPFYYVDDSNYSWFNIGGWGNTVTALEQCIGGSSNVVGAKMSMVIKTGVAYNIKVEVDSLNATLYVNGSKFMTRTIKPHTAPALYATANTNAAGDIVNLRIVNPYDYQQNAQIRLKAGYHIVSVGGEYLGGIIGTAENSATSPTNVVPKPIATPDFTDNEITYTVPRNSANFITITIAKGTNGIAAPTAANALSENISATYDLQGRRVMNPAHGVYIIDGRKVWVK
jgi:alpha-L-arabinofuranosidase